MRLLADKGRCCALRSPRHLSNFVACCVRLRLLSPTGHRPGSHEMTAALYVGGASLRQRGTAIAQPGPSPNPGGRHRLPSGPITVLLAVLLLASFANQAPAQVGGNSIPTTKYFNTLNAYYDGDYVSA